MTWSRPDFHLAARPVNGMRVDDNFRRRVLEDCLTDATAACWRRRADTFEWARPRPGDYRGRALPEEETERDGRLAALAEACRHKAELIETRAHPLDFAAEIGDALAEIAA